MWISDDWERDNALDRLTSRKAPHPNETIHIAAAITRACAHSVPLNKFATGKNYQCDDQRKCETRNRTYKIDKPSGIQNSKILPIPSSRLVQEHLPANPAA